MMGIGWSEMMVVVIVALLVFGPKELPQVLRAAGGYMRQFRRMRTQLQRQLDDALREAEREIDLEGRHARPAARPRSEDNRAGRRTSAPGAPPA